MSQALIAELAAYTASRPTERVFATDVPGVTILRSNGPREPMPLLHKPALCVVAQGAKREIVGGANFEYRAGEALLIAIETPATAWVSQATPERPFLGIVIAFDIPLMLAVFAEIGGRIEASADAATFVVTVAADELDETLVRLVRLLRRPQALPVLAPLALRELAYWLLASPYGGRVAAMLAGSTRGDGIVAAIDLLREHFAEPVRVEDLARRAHVSVSTFHRQFRLVTSMTPLQFQKQMRLVRARYLMTAGGANAETAAADVGYESPSQFSREYARMFGAPPRRDAARMHAATQSGGGRR